MAELEKVIKGLESCLNNDCHMDKCPYYGFVGNESVCLENFLMRDALELLKEYQEAKPLIDAISDSVHETAKMFRQNDGLKYYDDGSSEP